MTAIMYVVISRQHKHQHGSARATHRDTFCNCDEIARKMRRRNAEGAKVRKVGARDPHGGRPQPRGGREELQAPRPGRILHRQRRRGPPRTGLSRLLRDCLL